MTRPAVGLLDTSVVIDLGVLPSDVLPLEASVSALTVAELAAGPHATDDPVERARRQDRLQRLVSSIDPLPFDAGAAAAYGRVFASTRAHDRKARGPRMVDLMIAATALAAGIPLVTRNTDDVAHLEDTGLVVVGI